MHFFGFLKVGTGEPLKNLLFGKIFQKVGKGSNPPGWYKLPSFSADKLLTAPPNGKVTIFKYKNDYREGHSLFCGKNLCKLIDPDFLSFTLPMVLYSLRVYWAGYMSCIIFEKLCA